MVLIFTDLKKAQIYKIPYRNSPHQKIEILMSFDYLHVFGPDENNKDGKFLFCSNLVIKNIFMWEKIYLILKQMMKLKIIFQNMVTTMLNTHLLTVKKIFTSWHIKKIFPSKNNKIR